jgi:predicted membrane protein
MNLTNVPRGSIFALMLIVAGALLFLDNIGILPIQDIGAYWPVFIVIWGASMLDHWRSPVAVIWSLALIAWGILLILGNLHILHVTGSVFWPVMLIAFGASMLLRPMNPQEWQERIGKFRLQFAKHPRRFAGGANYFGNKLRESTVFGSLNKRVQTQQFEGGKLEAVFGSIELDLTEAAISSPDRRAYLELNAVFGGIELTVPRTWRVEMKNAAVLGGCEDRTIPPRPEPGVEPATLVVTGAAVFGGIEIRN